MITVYFLLTQDIPQPPESSVQAWMLYIFALAIIALFLFMIKLVFIVINIVKENAKTNAERNEIDRGLKMSIDKHNDLLTQALAKGLRKNGD